MKKKTPDQIQNEWSYGGGTDPNLLRRTMSSVSSYVRNKQFSMFTSVCHPTPSATVLDVGVSPDLRLSDTNFFEQVYPYPKKLTVASIEDCRNLVTLYHLAGYIRMQPNEKLKVKDKAYDIVVAWATLEHVGSRKNQKEFIRELSRIGKQVFITTPDRYSFYEPHTVLPFVHWLPMGVFRAFVSFIGKKFWADENNLNMLSFTEVKKLCEGTSLKVVKFKMFGMLASHIIIYGKTT